ncbi:MAG: hypothetical protein WD021_01585 [Rhodothermales bacterium]
MEREARDRRKGNRRRIGRTVRSGCALLLLLLVAGRAPDARAQASGGGIAGDRHAVLIGGLGGNPAYTETFSGYLRDTRAALVDRAGFVETNVLVLAEQAIADEPFVDGVSTAEAIRAHFTELADRLTADDHLYVILYGHGSFDGSNARLNIPRRDLDDFDYAALLDGVPAGRVVFVNTTSASGPFAAALSAPERIVITATASGTERDETIFPRFFADALRNPDADLDKNGGLSVLEAFTYAAQRTGRYYEESGQLATEHPQLEDNADGSGSRVDALDGEDGNLASITYIRPRPDLASVSAAARPLLQEKETLERIIAETKNRKAEMTEDAYYAELEELFVRLARLNERMDSIQ